MNDAIDRSATSRRPDEKPIGRQSWSDLLFLHREVPVDLVAASLPAGLAPDLHEGKAYVGIVPFKMSDVRPWWIPRAAAFRFLETNVRTYVTRDGEPGVYFYSLEANSPLAVFAARTCWRLPYFNAEMTCEEENGTTVYTSRRAGWGKKDVRRRARGEASSDGPGLVARYRPTDRALSAVEGSLDRFLIERYYLFVRRRGAIWRGQVHHAPYPLREVVVESAEETLIEAAGFPAIDRPFTIAHWSPGVDVEIFALRRLADSPSRSPRPA